MAARCGIEELVHLNNGEVYYRMNGGEIWVPREAGKRPDRELLEWHADTIFLG